jgi:hypothetical protein
MIPENAAMQHIGCVAMTVGVLAHGQAITLDR